eukprot:467726-Lingulodinium_polyedra.AAC.1
MGCFPGRRVKLDRQGLGADKEPIAAPRWKEALRRLCNQIRRTGCAPLQWHQSLGCLLNKPGGKKGMAGKRLVHVLDPLGKCWFDGVLRAGPCPVLPSMWHGFEKHRRRESALLVQQVVSHKLCGLKVTHASVMYDQRNAFGS